MVFSENGIFLGILTKQKYLLKEGFIGLCRIYDCPAWCQMLDTDIIVCPD